MWKTVLTMREEEVGWKSIVSSAMPSENCMLDFSTNQEVGYPFVMNKKFRFKEDLEHTIRKIHILQNRQFVVVNSSRTAYKVRCENEMYTWNLYAKKNFCGSWFIRNCPEPHTCCASNSKHEHRLLTDSFIAEEIDHAVWRNAAVGLMEISSIIESKYKIVSSCTKLQKR